MTLHNKFHFIYYDSVTQFIKDLDAQISETYGIGIKWSLTQVELMLESLHDRRVFVTSLFQRAQAEVKSRMSTSGVNFINILLAAFMGTDPKSAIQSSSQSFCTFGICMRKTERKMLVKLTSGLRREIEQLDRLVREKLKELSQYHNDLGSCVRCQFHKHSISSFSARRSTLIMLAHSVERKA